MSDHDDQPTTDDDQGGIDQLRLFQISRQLDRVRDDCRWLLRRGPEAGAAALDDAVARLGRLWEALEELLDDEHRAGLRADVGAATADSMSAMVLLTGQLAAWVDGLLLAPAFSVSEQARAFNASLIEMAQRARSADGGDDAHEGPSSAYL